MPPRDLLTDWFAAWVHPITPQRVRLYVLPSGDSISLSTDELAALVEWGQRVLEWATPAAPAPGSTSFPTPDGRTR